MCHKSPTPYTTLLNRGVSSIEVTNTAAWVTAGIICARTFKVLEEGLPKRAENERRSHDLAPSASDTKTLTRAKTIPPPTQVTDTKSM